jgi:hypothetical protein
MLIVAVWLGLTSRHLGAQSAGFLAKGGPAELDVFYSGDVPFGSAVIYLDTKPILLAPMLFTIYFDLNGDGVFEPAEELGVNQLRASRRKIDPPASPSALTCRPIRPRSSCACSRPRIKFRSAWY